MVIGRIYKRIYMRNLKPERMVSGLKWKTYMTTYNSFSVSKSTQSDNSHVWTITLQDDGTYAIVNTVSGKTVQFSSYGNYAPYTDVTGALPYLVKADKIAEKPEVPDTEAAKYATTVTCKTVSSAYTDGVAHPLPRNP